MKVNTDIAAHTLLFGPSSIQVGYAKDLSSYASIGPTVAALNIEPC
jgi:hypothetical protein